LRIRLGEIFRKAWVHLSLKALSTANVTNLEYGAVQGAELIRLPPHRGTSSANSSTSAMEVSDLADWALVHPYFLEGLAGFFAVQTAIHSS